MQEIRSKYDRMRQYYDALSEAVKAEEHDYFVEPTATVCVGIRFIELRVPRPSSPRLKIALERELQQVSTWLQMNSKQQSR